MKKLITPALYLDWKIAVLSIGSTLLLILDAYHPALIPWNRIVLFGRAVSPGWLSIPGQDLDRTILFLVIPLMITLLIFRENPKDYGFAVGDWRMGLLLTLAGILLMAPLLWLVSHASVDMQTYYQSKVGDVPWNTFVDLFGWEYLFRGWLLFGYARKFGPEALWLQAVPFSLAHIGKPEVETLSTIFGGFAFGWVAWKTKSFIWPMLIHWFVASFVILVTAGIHG